MAEPQSPNSQENQSDPKPPIPPSLREDQDRIIEDRYQSEAPTKAACKEKYEHPPINITVQQGENKEAKRANTIYIISASVNAGILIATLFIYFATKNAVGEYKEANKTAVGNLNLAKDANKSSSIDNERRFNLDSQIERDDKESTKESLAESKRQFKTTNEPYLQIADPILMFDTAGKKVGVTYKLENLKYFPAQIIDKRENLHFDSTAHIDYEKLFANLEAHKKTNYGNGGNMYVIKESPIDYNTGSGKNFDEGHYNAVRDGILPLYLVEIIKYKDLVSRNNRIYRCIIKLKTLNGLHGRTYIEYERNKNTDEGEK